MDEKGDEYKLHRTTELNLNQKAAILSLWNSEYPVRLNYSDISELEDYLTSLQDQRHLLLLGTEEEILGWYFDFIRGKERWFAMILDPSIQGHGYGSQMITLAKAENKKLSGWVIDHEKDIKANGEPYNSPLQFYMKNGFKIESDLRLELENISAVQICWLRP